MPGEPLYEVLFTTVLAETQQKAIEESLLLAKLASQQMSLSNAQLSGLVALANEAPTLTDVTDELQKRNNKRWKAKNAASNSADLYETFMRDIQSLRQAANDVITRTEQRLGAALGSSGAGLAPSGVNWRNEFHLQLVRRYLIAAVGYCRVSRKEGETP